MITPSQFAVDPDRTLDLLAEHVLVPQESQHATSITAENGVTAAVDREF